MIPLLAPQPGNPTQFEPQNGAISIANIGPMAMPLARARATLCVRFSIATLNISTNQRYAKEQQTSTAMCVLTDATPTKTATHPFPARPERNGPTAI